MSSWGGETIAALDVESTGLDPLSAQIVQAALVFVAPDGTVEPRSWASIVDPGVRIVDPGWPLPRSAAHLS